MPQLLRPKLWGGQKPTPGTPIDWGHPLAQQLAMALVLNEGGGQPFDALGGQFVFSEVGGAPVPAWNSQQPVGTGLAMVGTQNQGSPTGSQLSLPAPPRILRITQHITVLIAFNMSAAAAGNSNADNPVVIANDSSAGATRPWTMDVSVNKLRWFIGASVIGAANSYTGGPIVAAGVYNAASGVATLYKNAVPLGSGSGGSTMATSAYDLTIGFRNFANNTGHWSGEISYAYIWDRALSQAEIRWVYAEPFAMFAPPRAPSPPPPTTFPATAAGDLELTASATILVLPTAVAALDLSAAITSTADSTATADVELSATATESAQPTATGDVELVASVTDETIATASGDIELAGGSSPEAIVTAVGALSLVASVSVSGAPTGAADIELVAGATSSGQSVAAGDVELSASATSFAGAGTGATITVTALAQPFAPMTADAELTLRGAAHVEPPPPGTERVAIWTFGQTRERVWRFGAAQTLWVFGTAIPRSVLAPADQALLVP